MSCCIVIIPAMAKKVVLPSVAEMSGYDKSNRDDFIDLVITSPHRHLNLLVSCVPNTSLIMETFGSAESSGYLPTDDASAAFFASSLSSSIPPFASSFRSFMPLELDLKNNPESLRNA